MLANARKKMKVLRPPDQVVRNKRNARFGQSYTTETRNGQKVHVYKNGDVVKLPKPAKNPTGGIKPPKKRTTPAGPRTPTERIQIVTGQPVSRTRGPGMRPMDPGRSGKSGPVLPRGLRDSIDKARRRRRVPPASKIR